MLVRFQKTLKQIKILKIKTELKPKLEKIPVNSHLTFKTLLKKNSQRKPFKKFQAQELKANKVGSTKAEKIVLNKTKQNFKVIDLPSSVSVTPQLQDACESLEQKKTQGLPKKNPTLTIGKSEKLLTIGKSLPNKVASQDEVGWRRVVQRVTHELPLSASSSPSSKKGSGLGSEVTPKGVTQGGWVKAGFPSSKKNFNVFKRKEKTFPGSIDHRGSYAQGHWVEDLRLQGMGNKPKLGKNQLRRKTKLATLAQQNFPGTFCTLSVVRSKNNTHCSISNLFGRQKTLWSYRGGQVNPGGPTGRRKTRYTQRNVFKAAVEKLLGFGFKNLVVFVKGHTVSKRYIFKNFTKRFKIVLFKDFTGVCHNGCRPPKVRRV